MSLEENKAVIRRWADILNQGDPQLFDEIFAPGYIHRFGHAGTLDAEGFKAGVAMIMSAFPDTHGTLQHLIAEGGLVAARWVITGTHLGPFAGMDATGKSISVTFNIIFRVADGKILEDWEESDAGELFGQLRG